MQPVGDPLYELGRVGGANLDGADAVLVGPGLDDAAEAATLLASMLPELSDEVDLVLDAFALGALAHDDELTHHDAADGVTLIPRRR